LKLSSNPAIKFEAAVVDYSDFRLGPISLEFKSNLACIVGRSGSGKSTLLSLASGVRPPTSGKVFHVEKNMSSLSERTRSLLRISLISFAGQHPIFPEEETIGNHLTFVSKLRHAENKEVKTLLERFGLFDKDNKYPYELSGGELSRINVLRALIGRTQFVILDEPTAMLDRENADRTIEIIIAETIKRKLIIATHDELLIQHAKEFIELSDGKVFLKRNIDVS